MSGTFAPGDLVANRFEIHGLLGRGGMGVVYAVYDRTTGLPRALKTFHTRSLTHVSARRVFLNEMQTLLNLGEHPCIVSVRWMEDYDSVPFIVTDLISPDPRGRVTLTDHLRIAQGPLPFERTLNWGIQFCHAMEFCLAHGIRAHLDVKPDNVLIQQGALVKVSDFGIARALRTLWEAGGSNEPQPAAAPRQSATGGGGGTPGYMSPEVSRGESGDQRADIYAFGQVLWQMGTGALASPFIDLSGSYDPAAVYARQLAGVLPAAQTANLAAGLLPIVERCVAADPDARFESFAHLRAVLEDRLAQDTGMRITLRMLEVVPEVYWVDKGACLRAVGRNEEALVCYDRALRDRPVPEALINKSVSLLELDLAADALACCEQALALDPGSALAWDTKGLCLHHLGDREAAADQHRRAIDCDPNYAPGWANLAHAQLEHGRIRAALEATRQALKLDPKLAIAIGTEARALAGLAELDAALASFERAVELRPHNATLWADRAEVLRRKGHLRDAMASVERALALGNPLAGTYIIRGNCFREMGRNLEALDCFDQALALDPDLPPAVFSKASVLDELGEATTAKQLWARYIELAKADPLFRQRDSDYLAHARQRLSR